MTLRFKVEAGKGLQAQKHKLRVGGIEWSHTKKIPVLRNFKVDKPMGLAVLYRTNNEIWAKVKFDTFIPGYPALQVETKSTLVEQGTGHILITKSRVISIGICSTPNADPNIEMVTLDCK